MQPTLKVSQRYRVAPVAIVELPLNQAQRSALEESQAQAAAQAEAASWPERVWIGEPGE